MAEWVLDMNEPIARTITFLDLCQMGGSVTAALSGIVVVVIIVLTVLGLTARVRRTPAPDYAWWMLRIGLAVFFFGLAGFASDTVKTFMKISLMGHMGAPEILFASVCESLIKIMFTGSAAFVAVLGCLIVGPKRTVNR